MARAILNPRCLIPALCVMAGVLCMCDARVAAKQPDAVKGEIKMTLNVSSSAFGQANYIPKKYTGEGLDVSPPLKWTKPPAGTQSLALMMDDPDAPVGTFTHWIAWAIPPDVDELPEGLPNEAQLKSGMKQGKNDFNKVGYGGPMPPKNSDHRYFFKIFALDAQPAIPPLATRKSFLDAIEGHVLAQGELMGRFKR